MELRDLIVTPLLLIILLLAAYFIRPYVTDSITRRYFIPALVVRIIGALGVGLIYQFYYDGGDTFNYHTRGSRVLWEAFWDSPEKAWDLFFYHANTTGVYNYASRILFITDPSSFVVVRLAFIFDLITFSSYSGTAVLFAVLSFVGVWMFFLVFYQQFPWLHRHLALSALFIPSVFFWGSGVLKDTISLACLGIATYQVYRLFIVTKISAWNIVLLIVSLYGLYVIKIYILLTFLPAVILWIFLVHLHHIRSIALRVLLFPVTIGAAMGLGAFAIVKAGEDNSKYSIGQLTKTARITAYDIRYYTGKDAGSGYSIGELDGSISSTVKLAPQAINVSLFRPYLWEVRNPLMLLAAVESLALLLIVVNLVVSYHKHFLSSLIQPNVVFLMVFSLAFSFAVGVSTFNFGTLVRYKIPMLPLFAVGLALMYDYAKRERKLSALEITE